MNLYGRSILCTAALFMMASSLARAADPDCIAPDQRVQIPPVTPQACDAAPPCVGVPVSVFVPNLVPGFEFSASSLFLKPGANNLGYATVTTFLPVGNPQWAVETLDPSYQPGFSVGSRYAFPCSGNDIQINWEHLRTSDSDSLAVIQQRSGFLRSTRQGHPLPSRPTRLACST